MVGVAPGDVPRWGVWGCEAQAGDAAKTEAEGMNDGAV